MKLIFPKSISLILLVLITALTVRYLYTFYSPTDLFTADSSGYYTAGQMMLKSGILAHHSRPPVYPIFINLPLLLMNEFPSIIGSEAFVRDLRMIVIVQSLLGLSGLYLLYRLLISLKVSKRYSSLFSLFIGLNIMLIVNEKAILTESLATFLLIITSIILIKIISHPKYSYFFILATLFIMLMFLKPLYLLLPFVTVPIIILANIRNPKIIISSILILTVVIFLTFFYIRLNNLNQNYPGFSKIGDIDLLGQILYYNLDIESAKDDPFFYKNIKDYRQIGGNPYPFQFLEYYDPGIYNKPEMFVAMSQFNRKVLFNNLPVYLLKTAQQLIPAFTQTNDLFDYSHKSDLPLLQFFFNLLFKFYSFCQYLTLISLPAYAFLVFNIIRSGKNHQKFKFNLQWLIIGTIALFHIIFTIPFVYYDFGRLISPVHPELYLFSFFAWGILGKKISRQYPPKKI